ncbi:MAG: hypothetical protein CNC91_02775 [Flavobacteriales bacterium MED-G22]|nr:MAG: hypothetical protein CNC91_02775 [Flavobacteriales bacterium MED-G22]|tara:strand:- start:320 stop:745 length:426 start_codon:yes stop_codon:yes gene_type:complete
MLLNISYNEPVLTEKINEAVGKPFSLKQRLQLKGIGSGKLLMTKTSLEIHNLLVLDNNINNCNVELRPKGIIIRFRSLLETYGLIIPYFKLTVYKEKASEITLFKDHYFVRMQASSKEAKRFFKKVMDEKIRSTPPSIDLL